MPKDDRDILEVLKFELDFIEKGGYGRSVRAPWKPTSIFLGSPTCLNFGDEQRKLPCRDCLLIEFVPKEHQADGIPCHRIPLAPTGETIEELEQRADQEGMEEAVRNWLHATISRLERAQTPSIPEKRARRRILIVDDDEQVLMSFERLLEDESFETTTAWSGEEALGLLKKKPFDLVLLDDCLPESGLSSGDLLMRLREMEVQPVVIVMQAKPSLGSLCRFSRLGASAVIGKWMPRCEIAQAVRTCLAPAPLIRVERQELERQPAR